MDLRELGEFGLIGRIRMWTKSSHPKVIQGIGDDVAVMETGNRLLLVTTDMLIEGIHFERTWMDPFHLAKKALMVNLSDIAAMGGIPRYFLISLGIPRTLPFSFVSRFYRGIRQGSSRFGMALVGGDTSVSRKIIVNVCLLGEGERGAVLFRKGARVGDDLWVSGTLGDSALGLQILRRKGPQRQEKGLVEKHLSPIPRLPLGQVLAEKHLASAMIDVSDGLLSDASHLLEESKVGAMICEEKIPLSRAYRETVHAYANNPYRFALTGGEDYELLFTSPPKSREQMSSLSASLRLRITRIGKIVPRQRGLQVVTEKRGEYSPARLGHDHFR
jgi:thiamine-monophosphate kinase